MRPICLPLGRNRMYENEIATVAGWGVDSRLTQTSEVLKYVKVSIMDNNECKKTWQYIER